MAAEALATQGVDEYMTRSYRMELMREDGCWAARFPALPGLVAASEDWEGLAEAIDDAKRMWFETMLELGREIPATEPSAYSGNLRLRLPKSMHSQAERRAEREGVSLNTLIVRAIARELERQ